MSGLIRRADLFNLLATAKTLAEAYAVIQGMPEVDAVEVVRCKDCKYWERYSKSLGYCKDMYGFGRWWRPDDFCSQGARKDGDGDE